MFTWVYVYYTRYRFWIRVVRSRHLYVSYETVYTELTAAIKLYKHLNRFCPLREKKCFPPAGLQIRDIEKHPLEYSVLAVYRSHPVSFINEPCWTRFMWLAVPVQVAGAWRKKTHNATKLNIFSSVVIPPSRRGKKYAINYALLKSMLLIMKCFIMDITVKCSNWTLYRWTSQYPVTE